MPIAGLTVSKEAGFPRLGKIFKGAPKVGNKIGNDLDHFRLESDRPGLKQQFFDLAGSQPKELEVLLPYPTVEENFDPWMREYGQSGLKRQCDGETQVLHLPEGSANYSNEPIPCLQKTQGKCNCTRSTGLKVIIRDLFAAGHCGYFDLMTSSKHDIVHIQSVLTMAYQFKGSLLGIPFKIRRVSQEKSFPMGNKRGKKAYELIQIEPDPAWVAKQFNDRYAQMMGVETVALPPSEPRTYAAVQTKLEGAIAAKTLKPALTEVQRRVVELAKLTGHGGGELKKLCADYAMPTESAQLNVEQGAKLVEVMLCDRFDATIEGIEQIVRDWLAEGKPETEIFYELQAVEDQADD